MNRVSILAFATLFFSAPLWAARAHGPFDLAFQASIDTSSIPLTTDKIAELDPAQPNPQLRRWVIERKMTIADWKSRKIGKDLVGVSAGGINSDSTIYLRPMGPWYDDPSQFPCGEKKPNPIYSTQEGAHQAAELAARLWGKMLSEGRVRLGYLLQKVAAVNEKSASSKADRVFQEWIFRLDREWRDRVVTEVMPQVWKHELSLAKTMGYCKVGKKSKPSLKMTQPEAWMLKETPAAHVESGEAQPLSRAPSRRWAGMFGVRLDVRVSDNSILGQVLIDPATPRSILSPDWMRSQGMPPEWLRVPEADPERVKVALGEGISGLGPVLHVDRAILSDQKLSLSRFLLHNTDLYDEPDFAVPCCSGILGIDFLRRYVVTFRAAAPTEVLLWPIATFRPDKGYEWVEVRENAQGELIPTCTPRVKALPGADKLCRDPRKSLREATDAIVFDLPHGRVWYSPKELAAPEYRNTSGVTLVYDYVKGDRALIVKSLGKTKAAEELEKQGLKKGMVITEIDGLPAVDLDLWDVNRRLAGVYGPTVNLKWSTPQGYKSAPLNVLKKAFKPSP